MKKITIIIFVLSLVFAIQAQTTVFTYQGKLNDGVMAANGSYELRFKIYDTQTVGTGTQIGLLTQTVTVNVVNGIFTTQLDFGQFPFSTGADRFLEIAVRRNAGETFVTLEPRQPVTSSPYSIRSKIADTAVTSTNSTQLGGIAANQYVITTDSRMTDARDPLPGSANYIQNTMTQQSLSNFNISGEGKANIFSATTQFNIGMNRILSNAGTDNLFAGVGAGTGNTTGGGNSFVGKDSGFLNTTGFGNAFFGAGSGRTNSNGQENTFVGNSSGFSNTTGNSNTFVGKDAGFSNTTASFNSFFGRAAGGGNTIGSENSFFGYLSGEKNTEGNFNSFFGSTAGRENTTGVNNSFFGAAAGRQNMTGSFNAFFGSDAGFNTNANANSFFGNAAGITNTTGTNNAFFGADSGRLNTTGNGNAFLGTFAGYNNTIGGANTFVGISAGLANTTGSGNTLVGNNANLGANNLSNATAIGADAVVSQSNSLVLGNNVNVGIGTSTPSSKLTVAGIIETTSGGIKFPNGTIQTTAATLGGAILNDVSLQPGANFNIGGTGTGQIFNAVTQYNLNGDRFASTAGTSNIFVGRDSGISNTLGSQNTYFGINTGKQNILGAGNSFFGYNTGASITPNSGANYNSAFGVNSGENITSGGTNSFFGAEAGKLSTTGNQNSFFGAGAGDSNISGGNNTVIGTFADVASSNLDFATAIGAGSVVSTSNTIALGRSNGNDKVVIYGLGAAGATQLCRNANNEISTCSSSLRYKTNVADFTSGLSIIRRLRPITFNWKNGGMKDLGLGAEEVAEVDENLVIRNEKGEVEGVKYDRIGVVLVNAVSEQQQQIEAQKKQIEEQQKQLDEQKKQIEMLKQIVCSQNKTAAICQ